MNSSSVPARLIFTNCVALKECSITMFECFKQSERDFIIIGCFFKHFFFFSFWILARFTRTTRYDWTDKQLNVILPTGYIYYFIIGESLLHITFPLKPTSPLCKLRRKKVGFGGFPFLCLFFLRALQSLYVTSSPVR